MKEATIFILLCAMFYFAFTVGHKNAIQDAQDQKMKHLVMHKVDSMEKRYGNLFLLTLKLNNITELSRTTRMAKQKDEEVLGLMCKLSD